MIEAKAWDKPYTEGVGQAIYGIDMATGIVCFCVHSDSQFNVAHCLEHPMATKSVGIREFRAGLAEFIDNKQPVAVTRHGQTVGYFIPTARPTQADLQALRDAADKLQAIMSLTEDEVEAAVRDFDALRKGAAERRRKPA